LQELGRLEEAKAILAQTVEFARETWGAQTPDFANVLGSLGEVLHLTGEYEAAESAFRESLALRRQAFGQEHITIANSLNVLACLLVDEERFEDAEPLYHQSLEMRRRLYGPRRVEVTFALNGLARLYLRTDRPVEAEASLRESLGIFDETQPKHWRRGYAQCLLGAALTMQERFDEAEPLLVDGLSIVRKTRGDGDSFSREVLQYAVDLYDAWGKPDQASAFRALLQPQ